MCADHKSAGKVAPILDYDGAPSRDPIDTPSCPSEASRRQFFTGEEFGNQFIEGAHASTR
jgi:hypothetical protein